MPGVNPVVGVNTRLNYFRTLDKRPGPKNHAVQPVLMEFKYSQIPTNIGGNLALAINPSVALWNPYNVRMELSQLFVEVPIHQSKISSFNPKEFDRWRKWYMYNWRHRTNDGGGGGGNPPRPPPPTPPGWKNFIDLNGNGRRDPGEPWLGGRGPVGLFGLQGPAGKFPVYYLAEIGVITLPIILPTLLINYQEIIAHPAIHGQDLQESSNPTD